ncbi:MAG: hypothetical protein AAF990_15605 [Bacteroidota bacterium]
MAQSKWQRFAKITAGFIGGFGVSAAIHIVLAIWFDRSIVLITSSFSSFLLWSVLFVVAYIPRNGWRVWAIYLSIILLCGAIVLLHQ